MPRRLTTQQVKDLFAEYGYLVPDNFVYRNNKQTIRVYDEMNDRHIDMNLQKLRYQTDRAATTRQRYFDSDLLNLPLSDVEQQPTGSSFERWAAQQSEDFNDLDDEYKQAAFDYYTQTMPLIAQHRNIDISFDEYQNIPQLYGLISA